MPRKSPHIADEPRIILPGSERPKLPSTAAPKTTPPKSRLTVSVILKRKRPLKITHRPTRVSRADYKKLYAADPKSMQLVRNFAREFNLKVEPDPTAVTRRTMQLTGSVADMQKAFGVTLQQTSIDGTDKVT